MTPSFFPHWFYQIAPFVYGVAVFSTKLMIDALADHLIDIMEKVRNHLAR